MTFSVSVITPSFNQGRFIERTIISVLQQEISELEHWVIDGGSTDETIGILKKYEKSLNWVSEKDKGQTDAINKGILKTKGEIIGWLNSDDIYYPSAIQSARDFLMDNPDVDVVYGDANHIDEHDQIIRVFGTGEWNFERLKEICYLCQPAVFFRRAVFEKIGPLDEALNYCMDYEYWLRLAMNGATFAYKKQLFSASRLYPANKTLGSPIKVHKEINEMMKKKFKKVPNQWLSNYAHVIITENTSLQSSQFRFRCLLSILTLYASMHWNKNLNNSLLLLIYSWLKGSLIEKIIKCWKKMQRQYGLKKIKN